MVPTTATTILTTEVSHSWEGCGIYESNEVGACRANQRVKVKVGPKYDPYVGEVPVREGTCPGPSAL